MASITLDQLAEQTRQLVSDPEDRLYGDLDASMADAIKRLLEQIALSEVEQRVGVRLYERGESRSDYRNGYRERDVQTPYRTVTVRIPRLRDRGYVPSYLEPGHRAIAEVEQWVCKALLVGMHRIDIIRFMEETTGCRPSDRLIARVQGDLDLQAKAFKQRRLKGRYCYLFLDAAWVKDIVGVNASRVCILTALGITEDGEKEILGFERVQRESESSWRGFLTRLKERGLSRENLRLVISDEHKGLVGAIPEVFGDVAHQLCWAHRVRNIFKSVDKHDRSDMIEDLRAIYDAKNKTRAKMAFKAWKARWLAKYANLVASLEEDLGQLLLFYDCPKLHRKYLRTSNPIERVFLELRRRRFGCGAFANTAASDRIVFGVFLWLNRLWKGKDIWYERARQAKKDQKVALAA
jgi:transposase-like protein